MAHVSTRWLLPCDRLARVTALAVLCAAPAPGSAQSAPPEGPEGRPAQEGYVSSPAPDGNVLTYFRYVPDSVLVLGEGIEGSPRVALRPEALSALLAELRRVGALDDPDAPTFVLDVDPGPGGVEFGTLIPLEVAALAGLAAALAVALAVVVRRLRRSRARVAHEGAVRRSLDEGREAERVHIAREIHDGPVQELCALQMALVPPVPGQPVDTDAAREAVADVVAELRSVCDRLRPPALEAFGLGAALRALAERLRERAGGPAVGYGGGPDADEAAATLPSETQLALYRIAQEAANNAVRHARARRITFRLRLDLGGHADRLVLAVEDDGRGLPDLDPVALGESGHYGLLGMHERAAAAGADLRVGPGPAGGTLVEAAVPVRPGGALRRATGAAQASLPDARPRLSV